MTILEKAEPFLLNNARLLERQLFAHLFKKGSRDAVLSALRAYQNSDKGFGNALEPDKRSPSSQPIDQEFALKILDDIGLNASLVKDMCGYLESISTPEGAIPFVLPTVADAPRAPWWNVEQTTANPASINPTASIAGLLHKHKFMHPWLSKASEFCWQYLETLKSASEHDLLCILLFLEHAPERKRAEQVFEKIGPLVLKHTALELNAEGYVHPPYAYAPTPKSMANRLYAAELISEHLDSLIYKQQEDGGWTLSWPAVSPACELEYRGIITLNHLKVLKAYGYL
jgi:hypothetical protein